jgi:hypothetical protein
MKLLLLIFISIWPFEKGEPVQDAHVILEKLRNRESVAWQKTGENGKVYIGHVADGDYRLIVALPQQDGKWTKTARRHRVLTKASFNEKKGIYYYQGEEGYFSIKFSKTKRIKDDDFNPVFREIREEGEYLYEIANFKVSRNNAGIALKINKLTAAQFKRSVEKTQDISTMSIQQGY